MSETDKIKAVHDAATTFNALVDEAQRAGFSVVFSGTFFVRKGKTHIDDLIVDRQSSRFAELESRVREAARKFNTAVDKANWDENTITFDAHVSFTSFTSKMHIKDLMVQRRERKTVEPILVTDPETRDDSEAV